VADETDVSFVANTFSGVEVSGSATVHSGTVADDTTLASDAKLFLYSGGRITGRTSLGTGAAVSATGGTVDFDLTRTSAGAEALVNNLALVRGTPVYTLTVNEDYRGKGGVYALADGAAGFRGALTVTNASGGALGTLTAGGESLTVGDATYTLALDGGSLTVSVDVPNYVPAKSDVDGNGVSDVMFVWTGEHGEGNHQHGYWMNGTNDWRSADAAHPAEWDNLGCHDMSGDGRADAVMFGNVVVDGVKGAHVGYYQDGRDTDENWVTIGHLDNREDVAWQNAVGNLTGGEACSIVWYAPERYALGAWIDGTDEWVGIEADFGGDDWTLAGCGDFDGDGKESILMSGLGGAFFYTAGLDGAVESLGSLNWSGWDVRAIGDFAGDGRDDMVLFHLETGSMVMIADGDIDHYASLGQLDAKDWFVVGAGDYDGDARDDLLVRQYSTGMLGYYSAGDTTRWNVLGYGVDMTWTVISPS